MNILNDLWGSGTNLNALQMVCRGVVIFIVALILIRLSGRRSFGVGSPLDNIIVILLGAILSRAVVGASPFISVVATSTVIVLLHRIFSWIKAKSKNFTKVVEGDKIPPFKNGQFMHANMKRALVNKEDVMQELRKAALTEDLNIVELIYIERSGEISIVKKNIS